MARLNGARLLMLEKEEDKVVREIPVRTGQVQIGSNPTLNSIRLNAAGVEQKHCKIFVKNEKVFIANYSVDNPISVDKTVVTKRAALNDGSILEICGIRFRWRFDETKLVGGRPEKPKKSEQTPTSSKYGNRRRTTMVRKKLNVPAATGGGGSGKKPAAKKAAAQRTPTYKLPKNNKQLLKNIRKRFTVQNIMTRHNSEDAVEEEVAELDESSAALQEMESSPKPVTPQRPASNASSAANTPFFTPEPEKENSVPVNVAKTPKTPMLQLENSAMMILSYTPAIGSRSKANIKKTPVSAVKSIQRLNYLTPKNENVSISGTPLKSKAGNSMYLIDLTTPNSGHSSFVCSPMLDTTASSVDSPQLRLIDLTTPSPKNVKTPSSVLKSTQQKTLLKSALKNASRTPRTALRTATGTPVTPKAVPKITLNDTPTKSAVSTRSNKTTPVSVSKGSIRSKLETPVSARKPGSVRKEAPPATPTAEKPEMSAPKDTSIMTTDELFDTLVGRQSAVVKTYERKSTSPKKTPSSLVVAEDTSDMPKTDIDLWVESVVACVTSPEPVNMEDIIRKPNRTTQVRSSQYSDITPHESFAEATTASTSAEDTGTQPPERTDELDNLTDKPTIPNSSRRSETPLASKIARSLGNKRQTIGNFFTNIFGKLTVSPVTRISIADDSVTEQPTGEDSDGSDEVYHDSETDHVEVPAEQSIDGSVASSPKLRHSLRDTRKFIGNAWTSLNTSRPQLDNTAEIDESLLLSDTYNETTDVDNDTASEVYDLTDLGSRPATAQAGDSRTPSQRRSIRQSAGAFDISPLATPLESSPSKSMAAAAGFARDETGSFIISPEVSTATTLPTTPSRRSTRRQTILLGASDETVPVEDAAQVQTEHRDEPAVEEQSPIQTVALEGEAESANLNTSEMEPLEVSECHESVPENDQLEEPSVSNDLVDSRRSTRNSIATHRVATPKAAAETSKVPMSDSKLPVEESASTESCTVEGTDESETEKIDEDANVEQSPLTDAVNLNTSEVGQDEIDQLENPPATSLIDRRRSTRNSIATLRISTPKATAEMAKVRMSESNLLLPGLRKTVTESPEVELLDETVEKVTEKSAVDADLVVEREAADMSCTNPVEESAQELSFVEHCTVEGTDESSPNQSMVTDVTKERDAVEELSPDQTSNSEREKIDDNATVEQSHSAVVSSLETSEVEALEVSECQESFSEVDQPEEPSICNDLVDRRRSTRNSIAMLKVSTPKAASVTEKVPMSESKIPLRGLRSTTTETPESTHKKSTEVDLLDDSTGNIDVAENSAVDAEPVVECETVNTSSAELHSLADCSAQETVVNSPNQSMVAEVSEEQAEHDNVPAVAEDLSPDQTLKSDEIVTDEQVPSAHVVNLDTSEVEPLEVSECHESISEIDQPEEEPSVSNDLMDRRRSTRNSIATHKIATPKAAAVTAKVPMSESKLPLRGLQKTVIETPEVELLDESVAEKSAVEAEPADDATNTSCADTDKVVQTEDEAEETSMQKEGPQDAEQSSESAVDVSGDLVDETIKRDATVDQETSSDTEKIAENDSAARIVEHSIISERRSTRKSLAALTATPESTAPVSKMPMSESKLPLRRIPTARSENTPVKQMLEKAAVAAEPILESANEDTTNESIASDVSITPNTPNEAEQSASSTPLSATPASPVRSSRRSARSTPQNTPDVRATPSGAAPLLKRVLQKAAIVASTPKPDSNDSTADVSLQLDQLYKTPARVTRGKQSIVSVTPDVNADASLKLDELYETPVRVTRGSVTQASAKVNDTLEDSQADASLALGEMYSTPVQALATVDNTEEADLSLNLQELYKTPARALRGNSQQSAVKNVATPAGAADVSLNLQQLYKTPARTPGTATKDAETPKLNVEADMSPKLEEMHETPARSAVDEVSQSEADMTLDLQEMYRTPARTLRGNSQQVAVKNVTTPTGQADVSLNLQQLYKTPARPQRTATKSEETPKLNEAADMSLNLQEMYKTPARTMQESSPAKSVDAVDIEFSKEETQPIEPQLDGDMSLNLQEMYKTPARTLRGNSQQSVTKNVATPKECATPAGAADLSLNLQQLYKTPARTLRAATKNAETPKENVEAEMSLNLQEMYKTPARSTVLSKEEAQPTEPQPDADMSLNLPELYKTPARTLRGNSQQSAVKNVATPTGQADVSLNLQQLYKTPARTLGTATKDAETPKLNVEADMSPKLEEMHKTPARSAVDEVSQPEADMTLNLQEMYKTPARTLRGVSQLTPAIAGAVGTPEAAAAQPEPEADITLNLEQMYKTPARTMRGESQLSGVKNVKAAEVTPQHVPDSSAADVTPSAESSKVDRSPSIGGVTDHEADMTLHLEQMYKTPARQISSTQITDANAASNADTTLNLGQLYKSPARTLRGVTQLTPAQISTPAAESQSQAEISLNLQEMYKTPARSMRGQAQQSAAKEVSGTPQPDESNVNPEPLFKTPARATRARQPLSSTKVPAVSRTPTRASRSASKAIPADESSVLVSPIVGEGLDLGSEPDEIAAKAISSTPFNPRTRKSTLVATVGLMSPLNSSNEDVSEMHTEAIGITTIGNSTSVVDQTMQTMTGVFVAAQSRLLYDESTSATMLGDPLQVTNAVEPLLESTTRGENVTTIAVNDTVEPTVEESPPEANASEVDEQLIDTLIEASRVEQSVVDTSMQKEKSQTSIAGTSEKMQSETMSAASEADFSLLLPARKTTSKTEEVVETAIDESAVDETLAPSLLVDAQRSPGKAAIAVAEPDSDVVVESPKIEANKSANKTIISQTPTRVTRASISNTPPPQPSQPASTSKTHVAVTVNISITEQEHVAVPALPQHTTPVRSEDKKEHNVTMEQAPITTNNEMESSQDRSVAHSADSESSIVEQKLEEVSPDVESPLKESQAAVYIDANKSLDPVLLQQLQDRVSTLEHELAEIDDTTHGSSVYLERSDEQSLDLQESGIEAHTPKPMKRRLYTKTAPDDSTPERRESFGGPSLVSNNVYSEKLSIDKKADMSSEIDESKKVELPAKVLPSRASRRKITTLSEEALAGASPELKYVKPKQPKVSESAPEKDDSVNASAAEPSEPETSLGRRKVVFNENIQVKEINSPAFVGEIIKRGRGRNTKQVVTVTVDQHVGQSIKPATKRGKAVEPKEVELGTVETVEPEPKSSPEPTEKQTVASESLLEVAVDVKDSEEQEQKSEESAEATPEEPAAKRSRARKAPATKRATSRTKVESKESSTANESDETPVESKIDEPEPVSIAVKANTKRARRGAKNVPEDVEVADKPEEKDDVEPISKRIRHATEMIPETTVNDSEDNAAQTTAQTDDIPAKTTVKAPSRSRRGKKQDSEPVDATSDETPAPEVSHTKQDPTSKAEVSNTDVKTKSRRGGRKNVADEVPVEEAQQVTSLENKLDDKEPTIPTETQEPQPTETTAEEDVKPKSRRGAKGKTADKKATTEVVSAENLDIQQTEQPSELKESTKSKSRRGGKEKQTEEKVEEKHEESAKVDVQEAHPTETELEEIVKPKSRRGAKGKVAAKKTPAEVPSETSQPEHGESSKAEVQESQHSTAETKAEEDFKPKSRRGAKTTDKKEPEEIVSAESLEIKPSEQLNEMEKVEGEREKSSEVDVQKAQQTETFAEIPTETQEPQPTETTAEEDVKPKSRRGAKGKTAVKKTPAEIVSVDVQDNQQTKQPKEDSVDNTKSKSRRGAEKGLADKNVTPVVEVKHSEDVSSSVDIHEDKSTTHSEAPAKKVTRRGRGAQVDASKSENQPETSTLVVEKATADTTSQDDSSESSTKRSRLGAKEESNGTEKNEPATKRTRRAPKSKTEEAHVETENDVLAVDDVPKPKPAVRSRRGQKQDSVVVAETQSSAAVEKPTTSRTKRAAQQTDDGHAEEKSADAQEAPEEEKSAVEVKAGSRRGAKKELSEEPAMMSSPTLPPPEVIEQPVKRGGRQAAKRATKKDPPVEESLNESHMVKTMLPASHTSTPMTKTLNPEVEVPSGTRGRRAANPVITALIEESTPRTRARRGGSEPKEQVATPTTPSKRGRGRGAAAKAKPEDESQQTGNEAPQLSIAETSTSQGRGKITSKVEAEVVADTEPEPAPKRTRKAPAKLRDAEDDLGAEKVQPSRGRRGVKSKAEESSSGDATAEVTAEPSSEEPSKKKPRAAAKRTVKKADLNEESSSAPAEAPKSPPPKRTRKGAR